MKPKPSGGFEKPLYPPSGPGNFEKTTHQEWRDQPAQHDQFDIPNFHEADSDEGTNNFHQNVELHVDSQTFVTTEATLLASPEGSFFHMLMSHFPKSKEFYVDRSPVRVEFRLLCVPRSSSSYRILRVTPSRGVFHIDPRLTMTVR